MSDRMQTVHRLCRAGVVAVLRTDSSERLVDAAKALLAGGVDCIEVTMTTPNALSAIEQCRKLFGASALTGVGSVLDAATARAAIQAGAEFVVSPVTKAEIIETAHRHGLAVIPGAFTPTEILNATEAGADLVKVFPATKLGPQFFRDVLAPMPHLKLTPTGGVDLATAGEFIKAGAVTLGVGSALVEKQVLAEGNFARITQLAGQFVSAVAKARGTRVEERT